MPIQEPEAHKIYKVFDGLYREHEADINSFIETIKKFISKIDTNPNRIPLDPTKFKPTIDTIPNSCYQLAYEFANSQSLFTNIGTVLFWEYFDLLTITTLMSIAMNKVKTEIDNKGYDIKIDFEAVYFSPAHSMLSTGLTRDGHDIIRACSIRTSDSSKFVELYRTDPQKLFNLEVPLKITLYDYINCEEWKNNEVSSIKELGDYIKNEYVSFIREHLDTYGKN